MDRRITRHATRLSAALSQQDASYAAFQLGGHVQTSDGYPGRIDEIAHGPFGGNETYHVNLDSGLGGGWYSPSQLRPLAASAPQNPSWQYPAGMPHQANQIEPELAYLITTGELDPHTADIDYPEFGTILADRPDPAGQITVIGHYKQNDPYDCDNPFSHNYGWCHACKEHHDWQPEAEEHETAHTDWRRFYKTLPPRMYRGFAVRLPQGVHDHVHDQSAPAAQRAEMLRDHVGRYQDPLGTSWTPGHERAEHYATLGAHDLMAGSYSDHDPSVTHVVMHAQKPRFRDIERDPYALADHKVLGFDTHEDEEIPLRSGAPVTVRGISWMRDDQPEYTRHEFRQGHQHTAAASGSRSTWEPHWLYREPLEHPGADPVTYRGSGLKHVRHPADMPMGLYHGSDAQFAPGDHIGPGHPGNFVSRMKHVYVTEQPEPDEVHKGARGYGRHVYEVRPTGPYGHRSDARGSDWATEDPVEVIREIPDPRARTASYHNQDSRRKYSEEDEHGFSYPQVRDEDYDWEDDPSSAPHCSHCDEHHWPEDGHDPQVQASMDRREQHERDLDNGMHDAKRFCGVSCQRGYESDIAHGIGTHHTFTVGEPEWADDPHPLDRELWQREPHSVSPHGEAADRFHPGYEVRDPSAQGRCHYCRARLDGHTAAVYTDHSDPRQDGYNGPEDLGIYWQAPAQQEWVDDNIGGPEPSPVPAIGMGLEPAEAAQYQVYKQRSRQRRPEEEEHEPSPDLARSKSVSRDAGDFLSRIDDALGGDDEEEESEAEPEEDLPPHEAAWRWAEAMATDWHQFHNELPGEIHRGLYALESHRVFSVPMSDEDIAHGLIAAHQEENFPHDPDQHRLFGTHWTSDEDVARDFAREHESEHLADHRDDHDEHFNSVPVVFHAQRPQRHEIEEDPRRLGWQNVDDYDTHEREVPIAHGATVRLTGVSWLKHTGLGPMWHRHDFREPVELRAKDRDSPSDPGQWNASLHISTSMSGRPGAPAVRVDDHGDAPGHGADPDNPRAARPDSYDDESAEGQGDGKWSGLMPEDSLDDHFLDPADLGPRHAAPLTYDTRETGGGHVQPGPGEEGTASSRERETEVNGAQIGMVPEGVSSGGDGPGLEIGAFTAALSPAEHAELLGHMTGAHRYPDHVSRWSPRNLADEHYHVHLSEDQDHQHGPDYEYEPYWAEDAGPANPFVAAYYHGTATEFGAGDEVDPSYELGGRRGQSRAFMTTSLPAAHDYARYKADAQRVIGIDASPRTYEVEPLGPAEPDPTVDEKFEAYRTSHPMRVIREISREAKVPWTDHERNQLHSWSTGSGATEGDFVPSYDFTDKIPVNEGVPAGEAEEPQGITAEGAVSHPDDLPGHLSADHGFTEKDIDGGDDREYLEYMHDAEHAMKDRGPDSARRPHYHSLTGDPVSEVTYHEFGPGSFDRPQYGGWLRQSENSMAAEEASLMQKTSAWSDDRQWWLDHMRQGHGVQPTAHTIPEMMQAHDSMHRGGVDSLRQDEWGQPHTHESYLGTWELTPQRLDRQRRHDHHYPGRDMDDFGREYVPLGSDVATEEQHHAPSWRHSPGPLLHTLSSRYEDHVRSRFIREKGLARVEAASESEDRAMWHLYHEHGWNKGRMQSAWDRGDRLADMHDAVHDAGAADHHHHDEGAEAGRERRYQHDRAIRARWGDPGVLENPRSYSSPAHGGTAPADPWASMINSRPAEPDYSALRYQNSFHGARAFMLMMSSASEADPEAVYRQLAEDYPPQAIEWVRHARWTGPEPVPLENIDWDDRQHWTAYHQPAKVEKFGRKMDEGWDKPAIGVSRPGRSVMIGDGHHRALTGLLKGQPVNSYVAHPDTAAGPWDDMHDQQIRASSKQDPTASSGGPDAPPGEVRGFQGQVEQAVGSLPPPGTGMQDEMANSLDVMSPPVTRGGPPWTQGTNSPNPGRKPTDSMLGTDDDAGDSTIDRPDKAAPGGKPKRRPSAKDKKAALAIFLRASAALRQAAGEEGSRARDLSDLRQSLSVLRACGEPEADLWRLCTAAGIRLGCYACQDGDDEMDRAAGTCHNCGRPIPPQYAGQSCRCCAGQGEHATGHECYRCEAGLDVPEAEVSGSPWCEEIYRDPALHDQGGCHCGWKADTTEDFQNRGEPYRQQAGIDGTAGDAMDYPHPFTPDAGFNPSACVACGMGHGSNVHTALYAEHGERDNCFNCQEPIRRTGDDSNPWVHEHSHNAFCDVSDPGDAVGLAGMEGEGFRRSEAEPMMFEGAASDPDWHEPKEIQAHLEGHHQYSPGPMAGWSPETMHRQHKFVHDNAHPDSLGHHHHVFGRPFLHHDFEEPDDIGGYNQNNRWTMDREHPRRYDDIRELIVHTDPWDEEGPVTFPPHLSAANDPWGDNNYSAHPSTKPYGSTEQPNRDMSPASYGFLAGPDPEGWGEIDTASMTQSPGIGGQEASLRNLSVVLDGPDTGDWMPERQESFPYSDQSNTAGPSTSISARDPQGIRMDEAKRHSWLDSEGNSPGGHSREKTCRDCGLRAKRYGHQASSYWMYQTPRGEYEAGARSTPPCGPEAHEFLYPEHKPLDYDPFERIEQSSHFRQLDAFDDPFRKQEALRATLADLQHEEPQLLGGLGAELNEGEPEGALDPEGLTADSEQAGAIGGDNAGMAQTGTDAGSGAPASLSSWGSSGVRPVPNTEQPAPYARYRAMFATGNIPPASMPPPSDNYALDASATGGAPGMSHDEDSFGWDEPSIQTMGQQQWSGGGADSDEVAVEPGQPSGDEQSVIAAFQRSAAARQFAGSTEGSGGAGGASSGDIAAAARAYLSKTAQDHFSADEADQLIAEGRGQRARNLDLLDLDGTHYADLEAQAGNRGLSLDEIDDDLVLI